MDKLTNHQKIPEFRMSKEENGKYVLWERGGQAGCTEHPPSRFRFLFPKLSSFLFPNTKARQTDSLPDACSKIQEEIFLVTSDQVIWDRASPPVAIGLNLVQL